MKRSFWIGLLGLSIFLVAVLAAGAQTTIQVLDQVIESGFRDTITARLNAQSTAEITQVEFFYRVVGRLATTKNVAEFEPGNSVEAEFNIDQRSTYFPPGTELEYWWKVTDAEGDTLKTAPERYLYLDNRYDFKTLSNERLTLYWYRGGDDFGQALFDQANKGLDQLEENVGVMIEQPVKIFIYGNHDDLLNAISVGAQEWTGGQAFTDQGVVVMGVAPNNLAWGLKATTHELTHLIIHQATDNPYGDLPRWLDEGLAVYNEDPDRLDSQFRASFEAAVASDNLMTLQTLSSTFPADSQAANLAYGQSGAVVKFIIDTYGSEAMSQLLEIFSEGALYDDALEQALGINMLELNNEWLASLGLSPLPSTQAEVAPQTEAEPVEMTESAEPQEPVDNAAQTEPQTESEAEPAPGNTLPCLAGFLPILVLGGVFISKRGNKQSDLQQKSNFG